MTKLSKEPQLQPAPSRGLHIKSHSPISLNQHTVVPYFPQVQGDNNLRGVPNPGNSAFPHPPSKFQGNVLGGGRGANAGHLTNSYIPSAITLDDVRYLPRAASVTMCQVS